MNIHTLFILLIAMAMACDIFGIVVQRGANLVRIDVRTALMSLLWAVFELLAILAGYAAGLRGGKLAPGTGVDGTEKSVLGTRHLRSDPGCHRRPYVYAGLREKDHSGAPHGKGGFPDRYPSGPAPVCARASGRDRLRPALLQPAAGDRGRLPHFCRVSRGRLHFRPRLGRVSQRDGLCHRRRAYVCAGPGPAGTPIWMICIKQDEPR